MPARVSDAEWEILRFLWANGEATAAEVVAALQETTTWKPTTIKTLLSRLVKKRVVGFRAEIRGYGYFPLMTEAECARAERQVFLQKVYQGNVRPMLAAFLSDEALTPEDIEALKRLLEERS